MVFKQEVSISKAAFVRKLKNLATRALEYNPFLKQNSVKLMFLLIFVFFPPTSQVNHFRNKHKIYIQGTDLPEPVATFDQLREEYKICPRIMQNIAASGFRAPTPIQMQAIPVMLHVGPDYLLLL